MGFKGSQTLTSSGYKNSHKKKYTSDRPISPKSRIYKQYKQLHSTLHSKYTSPKQSISINSIMSRTHMATKISSQQNRQLALIDIDKLLSLSTGGLKENDIRLKTMRMVVNQESNRANSNLLLFNRLPGENQIDARRRQFARRMVDDFANQNLQLNQRDALNLNVQNNMQPQNVDHQQLEVTQNRGERNALGILRLVRAARMHYLRMSQQIANLGQQRHQIITPLQNLPSSDVDNLQIQNNFLPVESLVDSNSSQEDAIVISNLAVEQPPSSEDN